jgi:Cu-Zn family superoxide dismutase
MNFTVSMAAAAIILTSSAAIAADITIKVRAVSDKGIGAEIGKIRAVDTPKGLKLIPRLKLAPGPHGFHLHQNPSCANRSKDGKIGAAAAAGGHYDRHMSGHHGGPMGKGHFGDLPQLMADSKGRARKPVYASKLKVADLWGRAMIIHEGGDNYANKTGGARVACARIVKAKKGRKRAKK